MNLVLLLLLLPEYLSAVSEIIRDRTDLKVKTPNYPGNYPGNSTTVWRFQHGHGIWSVYIEQFNLQNTPSCQADYLEITDLRKSMTSKFCGSKRRGNLYTSKGSELLLKFQSDGSIQQIGFHLEVFHFFTEDDMEKTLKEIETRKSSRAKVLTNLEEKLTDSWIFYALLGVLGIALVVFIILFVCCVVGICKKTRRQNRYYQRNVVFQTPIVAPKSRRYSKSREDQQTVSTVGTDVRNPTRYV